MNMAFSHHDANTSRLLNVLCAMLDLCVTYNCLLGCPRPLSSQIQQDFNRASICHSPKFIFSVGKSCENSFKLFDLSCFRVLKSLVIALI